MEYTCIIPGEMEKVADFAKNYKTEEIYTQAYIRIKSYILAHSPTRQNQLIHHQRQRLILYRHLFIQTSDKGRHRVPGKDF